MGQRRLTSESLEAEQLPLSVLASIRREPRQPWLIEARIVSIDGQRLTRYVAIQKRIDVGQTVATLGPFASEKDTENAVRRCMVNQEEDLEWL